MYLGYLAALATLFCWTISVFALGRLSRICLPETLNKASLFYSTIVLGIVVCFLDDLHTIELFTAPGKQQWLWLGLSGLLGKSIGDYLGYSCIRILGVRRRSMLTTITPAFTWFFAFQFLGEEINAWGLAGIATTMLALFLLYRDQDEFKEVQDEKYGSYFKGLVMGFAGALLTGIAFVFSKKAFMNPDHIISEFHGTWIRVFTAFGGIFIFDLFRPPKENFLRVFQSGSKIFYLLTTTVVFGTILGLSFSLVAITHLPVAVAYTLFSLVPLTVIGTQAVRGQKKIKAKNWYYTVIAILGICMLLWRNSI